MKKLRTLNIANTIMKLFFFCAFPAAWVTGFSGIKYLCRQIHTGKPIEANAFVIAFEALVLFTILFGRFFCGRACAFGTYGDILHEIGKLAARKLHRNLPLVPDGIATVLRYLKYAVLLAVCVACAAGYDSLVSSISPWTCFSNLRNGQLMTSEAADIIGLVLFVISSAGMIIIERFFCRFLCPFGAVFSLLPVMPYAQISRSKSKCIPGCSACRNVCPADLDLQYRVSTREAVTDKEKDYAARMWECFQCGKCSHVCPRANAGSLILRSGISGIVIDIIKAVILAAFLYFVI